MSDSFFSYVSDVDTKQKAFPDLWGTPFMKSTRDAKHIPEKKNFSWNGKIGRFEIKSPDGFYDKNINSQTKKFSKSQVAFLYHFSKNHTHSIFISI